MHILLANCMDGHCTTTATIPGWQSPWQPCCSPQSQSDLHACMPPMHTRTYSRLLGCPLITYGKNQHPNCRTKMRKTLQWMSNRVCLQVLFADIPVALAAVDCDGTEASLLECQNNGRLASRCTNKTSSTVLACGTTATGAPSAITHEECGIIVCNFSKRTVAIACVYWA